MFEAGSSDSEQQDLMEECYISDADAADEEEYSVEDSKQVAGDAFSHRLALQHIRPALQLHRHAPRCLLAGANETCHLPNDDSSLPRLLDKHPLITL